MTIPLTFLARYAIPLIVATLYLGEVDIVEQMSIFDKTERLADELLSQAKGEGENNETFDYIIIGGGSSGAILANRLTASGEFRVLLLEAGGDPNPVFEVPYAGALYYGSTINDWNYTTVKQDKGCRETGGYCRWFRGKALGGCSSINGLIYNRCKPKDYDQWANFTGDDSWSWQNIRDTFNDLEDYHGYYGGVNGTGHGHDGEMYVGTIDYMSGQQILEQALLEKGIPVGDLNGDGDFTYGFSNMEYNIKDGLRWGVYQAFLQPILNRSNLVIYRHAYATKIETIPLDNGTYEVVGVTYQRHGKNLTAEVTKEIIVSAGVAGSAKLLMLSGIGPKQHLAEVGIQAILDLPVGKYLQDHPGLDILGETGGFLVNTTFAQNHNTSEMVLQFVQNGTGPFNAINYGFGNGYAHQIMRGYIASSRNEDMAWPELQIYLIQRYYPERDRQEFSFAMELVRTASTGRIKLASSDPMDEPLIDPNLLGDPEDVERMVDGIEVMMDVFLNSTTWKKYGIQELEGKYLPCGDKEGREYWKCYVEHKARPFFHPTSTCRMGPNSAVAVLDSKMKVFGTQNLRVIDASSMPFVPSGNTNMPKMLIEARGAEMILSGQ